MDNVRNGKEYVRKLINITYLSIGAPLLFFVWVYLEVSAGLLEPIIGTTHHLPAFISFLGVIVLIGVFGYIRIRTLRKKALEQESLIAKLSGYKKAITGQFMLYGVLSGLIAIGLFLTGYQPFEFLFVIVLFLVSIHHPNALKTVRELKLKDQEKDVITRGLDF